MESSGVRGSSRYNICNVQRSHLEVHRSSPLKFGKIDLQEILMNKIDINRKTIFQHFKLVVTITIERVAIAEQKKVFPSAFFFRISLKSNSDFRSD